MTVKLEERNADAEDVKEQIRAMSTKGTRRTRRGRK